MKKAARKRVYRKQKQEADRGFKPIGWLIGGSLAVVALTLVLLPFFNQEPIESEKTPVGVIAQYPQQFTGNTVEVQGEVTDRIGYRAFTLKGTGLLDDEILVVSTNPLEAVGGSGDSYELFSDNKPVTLSGQVQTFNVAQIEDQIGFDLPDDEFRKWEGKPVIVTSSVQNIQ